MALTRSFFVGRLGKDPEVRWHPQRGAVANLQVATSESWRDKQTGRCGSRQNGIAWCCSASSRKWQVNICARARRSTSKVSFCTRSWEDNGITRYVTEILLRPRAPCRCWGVHHSRTLSGATAASAEWSATEC